MDQILFIKALVPRISAKLSEARSDTECGDAAPKGFAIAAAMRAF
jgi:hypothetical protein